MSFGFNQDTNQCYGADGQCPLPTTNGADFCRSTYCQTDLDDERDKAAAKGPGMCTTGWTSFIYWLAPYLPICLLLVGCADFTFDVLVVLDLAKTDHITYAVWLGALSAIPFIVGLIAKYYLHLYRRPDDDATSVRGPFDKTVERERINFVICVSLIEIGHFLTEDATTLFVWWQSGLYLDEDTDKPQFIYFLNMMFTLAHAGIALIAVVVVFYYATAKDILKDTEFITTRGDLCCEHAFLYMATPVAFFLSICGWITLAIYGLMSGTTYNRRSNGSIGTNKGLGALYALGILAAVACSYFEHGRLKRAMVPVNKRKRKISSAQVVLRNDIGMLLQTSQYDEDNAAAEMQTWDEVGPLDPNETPEMLWAEDE